MTSPSPVPGETASDSRTVRSDSAASTRDSASILNELASQAIVLLQKADPQTVVTSLLKEKSYLHTQNRQLWRLVDKQRASFYDLQKDYQKLLQENNRYQARLKAAKQEGGAGSSDQNQTSTDGSSAGPSDGDTSQQKSPSRRSSARSIRSPRLPRTPQPGAQLDALQASLEAEFAKSTDESDSSLTHTPKKDTLKQDICDEPIITVIVNPSTPSNKPKRIPTPLDLSPARLMPVTNTLPRSALLAPRSRSESLDVKFPTRDPPPSAPPFQTTIPIVSESSISESPISSSSIRHTPPPLRTPVLPYSPRLAPSLPSSSPISGTIASSDYFETQVATEPTKPPSTPPTPKPISATEQEDFKPQSVPSTPTSPINPSAALTLAMLDPVIESSRKSPLIPRRSRMPSHRATNSISHTSASSSITTINLPTVTTTNTSPIHARTSRSFSAESFQQGSRALLDPAPSIEKRRSRSFDDLHTLMRTFEQEEPLTGKSEDSLDLIGGLDETILEMVKANEAAKQIPVKRDDDDGDEDEEEDEKEAEEPVTVVPPEPERPAPIAPPPTQSSEGPKSPVSPISPVSPVSPPKGLQPAFSARSRSTSNVSKVPLAVTPSEIPSILLTVLSVRSRKVDGASTSPLEETLFTIRCRVKAPAEKEILRVEKSIDSLLDLGDRLSSISGMTSFLNSFFDDFPVEKSDQRKAVDYFFNVILGSQLDDSALYTLAEFLSRDIVRKHDSEIADQRSSLSTSSSVKSPTKPTGPPLKEGYLTKRGKNFGGWQTRYFVLDGPNLKYYDTPNGVHLGSIKLPQAQIGRQNSQAVVEADESGEEQMRYAFLILEPKRNDASKMVRHVLCSQSDEDRDEWINALLYYVALDPEPSQGPSEKASRGKRLQRRQQDHDSTPSDSATGTPIDTPVDGELISIRYDHMATGKRPSTAKDDSSLRSPTFPDDASRLMPRSPDNRLERPNVPQRSPYRAPISGPINGAPITDEAAWSSTQREEERRREEKRAKKRSIWGLLSKDSGGRGTPEDVQRTAPPPPALRQHGLFGISLREAVEITQEMGMGINVPSVVYRCIEYLEHMEAAKEEGIYRLSGSSATIRGLKDKFNTEGDVDLVNARDYYDIHAVAGLLKLYLRELPSTVLTRERHVDFLHVVDIEDKTARIKRLRDLVHSLPKVNYELLRMISRHLKRIVRQSQENKMTIKNVGIVFSPTLNIPAPVFSLFITEYDFVFDDPDDETLTTPPPPVQLAANPQSYVVYNGPDNSQSNLHPNHHLSPHDQPSQRRYHSADPPSRSPQPPPSFPMPSQGYQESHSYRPSFHSQQSYPPQSFYQQQSYQQAFQHHLQPRAPSTYQQGRWASPREDTQDMYS